MATCPEDGPSAVMLDLPRAPLFMVFREGRRPSFRPLLSPCCVSDIVVVDAGDLRETALHSLHAHSGDGRAHVESVKGRVEMGGGAGTAGRWKLPLLQAERCLVKRRLNRRTLGEEHPPQKVANAKALR